MSAERCEFTDECRCTSCLNELAAQDRCDGTPDCDCDDCWESEHWADDVFFYGPDENDDPGNEYDTRMPR
jgi:hypothetical protein